MIQTFIISLCAVFYDAELFCTFVYEQIKEEEE